MKNLANCTPREFLKQTNRIRKAVSGWLKLTDIKNIRKRLPDVPKDATPEEKKKALNEQTQANLAAILENILDKCPDETADILGIICFIEPEELDNYTVKQLLAEYNEVINCPEVIDFFGSLMRLANLNTSSAAKA